MAKRKSTGKRQRFEIFKRDNFTCQYCGSTPPTVVLVVDHILPVSKGGGDEITNKITSCEACNQGKADRPLSDVPRAIESQLADQVERREQLEAYNTFLMQARERELQQVADLGHYWFNRLCDEQNKWIFGTARQSSIRTFLKRLPITELYDAIDIALARVTASFEYDDKAWRYFCGICWKRIREREPAP